MIAPRYVIGFIGHRSGYHENLIRPALTQVLSELKARAEKLGGQVALYCSIAEGSDILCVEIARSLGLAVHLLLPMEETEFAKDFSSQDAWTRAQEQLSASRRTGQGSVKVIAGETVRPACYFNQSIQVLDVADILVALWDGLPARGLGGVAQVIDHAKHAGVPVIQIAADTGVITGQDRIEQGLQPDEILVELNQIAALAGTSVP